MRLTFAVLLLTPSLAFAEGTDLAFTLRSRTEDSGKFAVVEQAQKWPAKKTAVIVCDMWDAHHCLNAVRREEEMVPRMNEFLTKARDRGALIIHAPSSCMDAVQGPPGPQARPGRPEGRRTCPRTSTSGASKIPAEEKGKYPIDQTDGGEDDDPDEHEEWHAKLKAMGRNPKAPWKSQHAGLTIKDEDAISDSGVEIWNLLEERGINNVILVGVHTNMCVLGRPFGLRQMAKNGKNVVLMRDLTDTMYNPKKCPVRQPLRGNAADRRAHREVRLPDDHVGSVAGRQGVPVQRRSVNLFRIWSAVIYHRFCFSDCKIAEPKTKAVINHRTPKLRRASAP